MPPWEKYKQPQQTDTAPAPAPQRGSPWAKYNTAGSAAPPPVVSPRDVAGSPEPRRDFIPPASGSYDPALEQLVRDNPGLRLDLTNLNADPVEDTGFRAQLAADVEDRVRVGRGFADLERERTGRLSLAELRDAQSFAASTLEERMAQQNEDRAAAFRDAQPDIPGVRSAVSGFQQSVLSSASLLERVTQDQGQADNLTRIAGQTTGGGNMVEAGIEGAARSLTDMFSVAAGGPAAVIGMFVSKATNDAVTEGKDAGLEGAELAGYAVGQGAIEGVITTAFQRVGLGGLESTFKQPAKQGLRAGLRQAGVATLAELPEEVTVELAGAVHRSLAGVDPDALTAENLADLVAQTTVTTLITMGAASGPGVVASARQGGQTATEAPGTLDQDRAIIAEAEAAYDAMFPEQPSQPAAAPRRDAEADLDNADLMSEALEAGILTPESAAVEAGVVLPEQRPTRTPSRPTAPAPEFTPDQVADRVGAESAEDRTFIASLLEQADSPFVEVNVPLDKLDLGIEADPTSAGLDMQTIQSYAGQNAETAPPIAGLPSPTEAGQLFVADGRHRALAAGVRRAKAGGSSTIRALVPKSYAQAQGLMQNAPQTAAQEISVDEAAAIAGRGEMGQDAPAEAIEAGTAYYRTELAKLEGGTGPFVRVDVPLDSLDTSAQPRAEDAAHYAQMDPATAPAGIAGVVPGESQIKVLDGNTRVEAARMRGDSTVPMIIPRATAEARGLINGEGPKLPTKLQEAIDAVRTHGGIRPAGRATGIPESTLRGRLKRARVTEDEIVLGAAADAGIITPESAAAERSGEAASAGLMDDLMDAEKVARAAIAARYKLKPTMRQKAGLMASYRPSPSDIEMENLVRSQADVLGKGVRTQYEARYDRMQEYKGTFDGNDTTTLLESAIPALKNVAGGLSGIPDMVSKIGTPTGSVIRKWAPRLYGRLKQMQAGYRRDRHDADFQVHKLERMLRSAYSRDQQDRILYSLQTGNFSRAREVIQTAENHAEIEQQLELVMRLKDRWRELGIEAGLKIGEVANHFPRQVRPSKYAEWTEILTGEERIELDRLIAQFQAKKGREATLEEKSDIANKWLGGYARDLAGRTQPRNLSRRSVENLTFEEWKEFYQPGLQPAYGYFDRLIYNTHKARLFGKNTEAATLDETIGQMFVEGKYGIDELSAYQQNRLKSAIKSIFTGGEQSPSRTIQVLRNLGYMGTLMDPSAAAIQFGDLALVAARDGTLPMLRSIPQAMREQVLTASNVGLDHLSEEYSNSGKLSKALRMGFKAVGFHAIDTKALNVSMVSAVKEARRTARKRNLPQRWLRQWEPVFGEDFPTLIQDLHTNNVTEIVQDYAFMAASEIRPVDSLDMPEFYNQYPNARIFYMLKGFAMKQFDFLRQQGYNKIARGVRTNNPRLAAEGLGGLVRAMMMLALAGGTVDWLRDWMLGRNPDFSKSMVDGLLYTHFGSLYLIQSIGSDGPGSATADFLAPPVVGMTDTLWRDLSNGTFRATQHLPFGRTLYSFTPENRARQRENARKDVLERAAQAWADGDRAAAATYVRVFNQAMKDNNSPERLTMSSVRRSAASREKE